MKRLIVTADDFGLSVSVNEAVEQAHRDGILTCAGLMVAGPAAADAIARARRLPGLGVGLHLVLTDGTPVLPRGAIPDLAPGGELSRNMIRAALRIQFRPAVRRQMEREVHAQFDAFRRTGLRLDHVNGHHHYHLHPRITDAILANTREFQVPALRVPYEPPLLSYGAAGDKLWRRLAAAAVHGPPAAVLRRKARRAGLAANDRVFGLADSGGMTRERLMGFLAHLPDGVTELYFHPAASGPGAQELAALTDKDAAALVGARGIGLITFSALPRP